MRERRFLVTNLLETSEPEISGSDAHHLLHVLRLRPGDEVVLLDGRGHQCRARLLECRPERARAQKLDLLPSHESSLRLSLAVALVRDERFALAVQKLTELGVNRIAPFYSQRSGAAVRRALGSRPERWRRIAALPRDLAVSSCLAVVGPEGGLTEAERSAAREAGFRLIGLGPRTLRTETSAIVAATLLQNAFGDL
jgi:16S rRNA (uracil1498-N3)-methyltransferase